MLMNPKDLKHILFLPSWYPNPNDEMIGLFIKNQAFAAARFSKVSVLSVLFESQQAEIYKTRIQSEENYTELIFLVKKSASKLHLIAAIQNTLRLITAYRAGFKILTEANGRIQLIHVHILTKIALLALWHKIAHRIPFVISEHWSRYLPENNPKSNSAAVKFYRFMAKHAAAIVPVSNYLQQSMQALNIQCRRFEQIPNVVDNKRFLPPTQKSESTCTQFIHISCFEDKSKNISGILAALKILKTRQLNFRLSFIGYGNDFMAMQQLAKKLDVLDCVEFAGERRDKDLVKHLQDSDCMVLFSRYETFGTVVLESYACAKPVILSRVAALPEIAPPDFSLLVESENEEQLADAMQSFIENKLHFDVDAMPAYIDDNFSLEAVGARLTRLYSDVLSSK